MWNKCKYQFNANEIELYTEKTQVRRDLFTYTPQIKNMNIKRLLPGIIQATFFSTTKKRQGQKVSYWILSTTLFR